MNIKKLIPLFALGILLTVSLSLSGCGLFTVNSGTSGNAISKNKLSNVPLGSTQNDILSKFGEPSRQSKMKVSGGIERVWFYCWSRGTGGTFLYGTFSNEGSKTKCATFIFNKNKLVSKGIGAGSEPSTTAVPAIVPVY
ncbi:MAG: hypothetical protein ACYCTD_03775 [bacterium]